MWLKQGTLDLTISGGGGKEQAPKKKKELAQGMEKTFCDKGQLNFKSGLTCCNNGSLRTGDCTLGFSIRPSLEC